MWAASPLPVADGFAGVVRLGNACDGLDVEGLDDEPSDNRSMAGVVAGPVGDGFDMSTNARSELASGTVALWTLCWWSVSGSVFVQNGSWKPLL